jgi:hypothetical protein
MLEVSGEWEGEIVDEKLVSAQDLVKHFNLPFKKGDKVNFRLHSSVKTKDLASGKLRFADRRQFAPIISGVYKGSMFTIRYYERKRKRTGKKNNGVVYTPLRLAFLGEEMIFDTDREFEKTVFMFLYSSCADSPLRAKRAQKHWEFFRPDQEAAEKLVGFENHEALRLRVMELKDDEAMYIAKAIQMMKGLLSAKVKLTSPAISKLALVDVAMKNPQGLKNALDSLQIEAAATIIRAQEEDQILLRSEKGGRTWVWHEDQGGTIILKVGSKAGNPVHKLIEHLTSSLEGLSEFKAKLNKETPNLTELPVNESNDDSSIEEMEPDELFKLAVSIGAIGYHPDEQKVYLKNENGQFVGNALKANVGPDWESELAEGLPRAATGKLRKHLVEQ